MSTSVNLSELSIDQIPDVLPVLWKSGKVGMLWGPPGVGKSHVIKDMTATQSYLIPENPALADAVPYFAEICGKEFTGRRLYDNRLLLMNPTDIKGLPVYNADKEEAEWLATNNFPMAPRKLSELIGRIIMNKDDEEVVLRLTPMIERGLHDQHSVIFLDELSLAPKLVQGAALQLILDRKVGEYEVPEGVDIVAAGNRLSDKVGASSMSPAMVSRMVHFNIEKPSFSKWKDWAFENDIAIEVIGYLDFDKEALFEFDANQMSSQSGASSYPCPRTWEFASSLYKDTNEAFGSDEKNARLYMEAILSGTLGEGAASNFLAWVDVYIHLPDPKEVLSGKVRDIDFIDVVKQKSNMPDERKIKRQALSLKYAFISSLMMSLKQDFTYSNAVNTAAFVNKNGIEDAEWGMVLLTQMTSFYRSNDNKETIQIFQKLTDPSIKDDWSKMNEMLAKVVSASDLVSKAGA